MDEVIERETATFHVTPGYGVTARDLLGYSQAVRIGNRVETSGQGGWDDDLVVAEDLEQEIVRAFDNVGRTLAEAGATWADVVHVNSYHKVAAGADAIGDEHNNTMISQLRARMPDHAPIWTETGVTALGAANMRVEIRVTALVEGPG